MTSPPASPGSASSGSCAYPYHSPRLAPTYQAVVPPSIELTRQASQVGHSSPRLIWRCSAIAPGKVQRFLDDAGLRASFALDEQALLSLLDANSYDIDAGLSAVSESRPCFYEDLGPDLSWANTWMRKVVECGSSLAELEAGLKVVGNAPNSVDKRLVKRCRELRDRAMEFNVQVRDASANSGQPVGISRLRNIIQNYTGIVGPNIDTPALQIALDALHASKHAKRRLYNCTNLDKSRNQGHEMSHDEAVRLQNLVRQRASFVAIPNMQQLDSAIKATSQIVAGSAHSNQVATPLGVHLQRPPPLPPAPPAASSATRRKWDEAISRRGESRLSYAQLRELASGLDKNDALEAADFFAKIDLERQQLREKYSNCSEKEITLSSCIEHLQELSHTIHCIVDEETALKNLIKNTELFLEHLTVHHSKYQQGQSIHIKVIESMIAMMASNRVVKVPWTGDERGCPVTWLRNVRAFATWVEDRVKSPDISPKTAADVLMRLRVSRIIIPDAVARCESAMKGQEASAPAAPAPNQPSPSPQVQYLIIQLQKVAQGSFRPTVTALMQLWTSLSRAGPHKYDSITSNQLALAHAILQRGMQWVDQAQTMLNQVQNDAQSGFHVTGYICFLAIVLCSSLIILANVATLLAQIKKHIVDSRQLSLDLTEYVAKLETRLFENEWLQRVVKKHDLKSQLELFREAENRCSPRIQNTVQVLRQHLVCSFQWLDQVQKQLGPFFADDLRFNFKNPLQDPEGSITLQPVSGTSSAPECPCRRSARSMASSVTCTSCVRLFHRSCLGFHPASETPPPELYLCMDCCRKSSLAYQFADLYPPPDDQIECGPRGLTLAQLEGLASTLPPKFVAPQKDAFHSLLQRTKSWVCLVQEATSNSYVTVEHLVDLYRDGEDIRVELNERRLLADMIHAMRRKPSQPASIPFTSEPGTAADVDAQSSESSETCSIAKQNGGEPECNLLSAATRTSPTPHSLA